MIYKIYPTQDASIYEKVPKMNTGIDALLEIGKTVVSASTSASVYNNRILLKFDYTDLDVLSSAGFTASSASNTGSYFLKLYAVEEKELAARYTLEVNTISGSWTMGLGRYDHLPKTEEGVSWKYRNGELDGVEWMTASFIAGSTGSFNINGGGTTWYTSNTLSVTKSINFNSTTDPEINVSSIVLGHLNNTVPNDGILVRRESSEEKTVNDAIQLQYYSSDTNTVYLPHLIVKHNDWTFTTGSILPLTANQENVVYFYNLNNTYTVDDRAKLKVVGRPRYPVKTFATASSYSIPYYLPASSSYAVEDLHTKEVVIPYDDVYTRISCNSSGSYFNFWMNALQPERWYKFTIKCKYDNNLIHVYDSNFIFKVERSNNA